MNASRIAMLVALIGLMYVLSPWSFSFDGLGQFFDGSFPWILFAIFIFFASKKGGCGKRTAHCAAKAD